MFDVTVRQSPKAPLTYCGSHHERDAATSGAVAKLYELRERGHRLARAYVNGLRVSMGEDPDQGALFDNSAGVAQGMLF